MKAVIRSCTIFLDHLDFILFMFGSQSWNQDEFPVSCITRQKFIFLFFEEPVWIWGHVNSLFIIWIAVWQIFIIKVLISGSKFLSPSMKGIVGTWSCAISLNHLDFRLLCVAHIVKIRMNLLSVSFRDGSSSYLRRKLLEF